MEYFDIVDEFGNKTGNIVERTEAHRLGICHRVIQVWIINSKQELLLQKRSANKDICPDMWYVSLGGHIEAGESNDLTIKREFAEELGLDVNLKDVAYLYTFQETAVFQEGRVIDNEFYDVYLLELDLDLDSLSLQAEEVAEVKFMNYHDFKLAVQNSDPSFWIHEKGFTLLFEHLEKLYHL